MRLPMKRFICAIRVMYLRAMLRGYEQDLRGNDPLCVNGAEARAAIREELREIRRKLAALEKS